MQDLLAELKKMVTRERERLYVVMKYLTSGDFSTANSVCESVVEQNPDLPLAQLVMGYILILRGEMTQAILHCQEAIRLDSNFGMAHFMLAFIHYDLGELDQAITESQRAVDCDAKKDLYYYFLGELYSQAGQYQAAAETLQLAINNSPHNTMARYKLANAYLKSGQESKAINEVQSALRSTPSFNSYMILGDLNASTGHYLDALEDYSLAISANPRLPEAHMKFGEVCTKLGEYESALLEIRTAIKIRPNHALSHYLLGTVYLAIGRSEGSIEAFRSAVKIDPDIPYAQANIGQALLLKAESSVASIRSELQQQAMQAFHAAANQSGIECISGEALLSQAQFSQAAGEFRRCLMAKTDWIPVATAPLSTDATGLDTAGAVPRQHRYGYSFPLTMCDKSGASEEALTVNVSGSGMLVQTSRDFGLGSLLDLVFQFATAQRPTTIKGRVVRTGRCDADTPIGADNFETGIEILLDQDEESEEWRNLLDM